MLAREHFTEKNIIYGLKNITLEIFFSPSFWPILREKRLYHEDFNMTMAN